MINLRSFICCLVLVSASLPCYAVFNITKVGNIVVPENVYVQIDSIAVTNGTKRIEYNIFVCNAAAQTCDFDDKNAVGTFVVEAAKDYHNNKKGVCVLRMQHYNDPDLRLGLRKLVNNNLQAMCIGPRKLNGLTNGS